MWRICFCLMALSWLTEVDAQTVRKRSFYQASRALAMGDAFSAYNVGFEAVYYNPAGVARRSPPKVKYIDFEIVGSAGIVNFFTQSISSMGSLGKIADNVAANPGVVQGLGISYTPQFIARNVSVGVILRSFSEAYVDPETLELDLYAYADMAAYLQYGIAFAGGVVKLGVGAKFLNRAQLERTFTVAEYSTGGLSFGSQWQEGLGIGFDAGLMITAPIGGLPTIGISVLDVGGTQLAENRLLFSGGGAQDGAPPDLPQKVNIGFATTGKHAPAVKSGMSLEIKDVLNLQEGYVERLHAGWELNSKNQIFLRAGLNQGRYWTAGLGLYLGGGGVEFTTYGENLLLGTGARRDDRKFVGRYVLSF